MRRPPSLLCLTIDAVVFNIGHVDDLNDIPDPLLSQLFFRTLKAGKLTEKVVRVFMATGNPAILSHIRSLNIKIVLSPILPTRCSEKF